MRYVITAYHVESFFDLKGQAMPRELNITLREMECHPVFRTMEERDIVITVCHPQEYERWWQFILDHQRTAFDETVFDDMKMEDIL